MKKNFIPIGLLLILSIAIINNAFAQSPRNFPADSQFGELSEFKYPLVIIDDKELYIGTGGQVRGVDNLIVLPAKLEYTGPVQYQLDAMGYIYRLWFLTADEAARAEQQMGNGSDNTIDTFLDFFKF